MAEATTGRIYRTIGVGLYKGSIGIIPNAGTTNYTYDANGNRISDSSSWYEYDAFNRLVQVRAGTSTGAIIETYQYDDTGQRTQKYEPATNATH